MVDIDKFAASRPTLNVQAMLDACAGAGAVRARAEAGRAASREAVSAMFWAAVRAVRSGDDAARERGIVTLNTLIEHAPCLAEAARVELLAIGVPPVVLAVRREH